MCSKTLNSLANIKEEWKKKKPSNCGIIAKEKESKTEGWWREASN